MPLVFKAEDGSGDPDATSYCTVEFADDYVALNTFQSSAWAALDEGVKENLLMRASKMLDVRFLWAGQKVEEESGLRWPRAGTYDRDGFAIGDDVIPQALQEATAEFATYLMNDDWTAPREADQFKEVQVDAIDIKYNTDYRRAYIPDTIVQMLDGLGSANTGKRPRFVKIVRS